MVFLMRGKKTYQLRVSSLDGRRTRVVTTGTTDAQTAEDVGAFVATLKRRRNARALDALLSGRLTLPRLYDADVAGTLDALLAEAPAAPDPDLSPLVAEWAAAGAAPKRVQQVRRLIPAGRPFPRSEFTRKAISRFLATLTHGKGFAAPVAPMTRQHYKVACSVFAEWLIEREVLESNPARGVKATRGAPRTVHYSPVQARALVDALAGSPRIAAALMAGAGVEWQAVERLRRRDVDVDTRTLRARGGKTRHRDRIVEVTEPWAWAVLEPHLRTLAPNAPVVTANRDAVIYAHKQAAARLGLEPSTLHDWRHTYAVTAIQRGDDHQQIKRQLGHSPASPLLYTVYGVYIQQSEAVKRRAQREAQR